MSDSVGERSEPRQNRADQLRDLIEEDIASGRLPPGSRLEESALAERFNVSRTPVREALAQLASAGLVEMRPRQGAVVAVLSLDNIIEMFEVMADLEALCAELCARRMTPEEQARLQAAHERCAAVSDTSKRTLWSMVKRLSVLPVFKPPSSSVTNNIAAPLAPGDKDLNTSA